MNDRRMPGQRFERIRGDTILVISLIGHYERIAHYLFREDALRENFGISLMTPLRVKARSPWSLLKACTLIAWYILARQTLLVAIPRSNSRAIRLLTSLFARVRFFTYSDGLGDSIHRFYMEGASNYVGHIGFPSLSTQPLIHEIPLTECIEPWGDLIRFDERAPVLLIVKIPKETTFDAERVTRLYARTIEVLGRNGPVLLSGGLPGLQWPDSVEVRSLGPLMKLPGPLAISGAVGLPSTVFLTLVTKLPAARIRIMCLCSARHHPDADRRIRSMKQTLECCMRQLITTCNAAPPDNLKSSNST
jgi:hypothetical protein